MDDGDFFDKMYRPTAARPLLGLTVLVVEDSKYACDAMRLMCLSSGARIRRADCLKSARRHLQVYRPSVVLVDLGLPDGSGADLISELSVAAPRVSVILGISGDSFAETVAIASGADGFIEKPIPGLAAFQTAILAHLPADRQPRGPRFIHDTVVEPDPIAYCDDMAHAADILCDAGDISNIDYVAQFLTGVARSGGDAALAAAAEALTDARTMGRPVQSLIARVAGLVQDRLSDRVAI